MKILKTTLENLGVLPMFDPETDTEFEMGIAVVRVYTDGGTYARKFHYSPELADEPFLDELLERNVKRTIERLANNPPKTPENAP